MTSSPASSSRLWNNDVFLSFRGEDSRKSFVDHLYSALVQQGIYTYKDDEELPPGESIAPTLLMAIQESRIAVIVISENYVDSSWCLEELAYIMKCMDERGQIVMPIFYNVDPSDMRKLRGKFGEAFAKHELENSHKIESWRTALLAVGDLSGWVTKDIANGHESKCIKQIVDAISHRLRPMISCAMEKLIGIEARMQDLKSKLELGLGGVLMVGIWGVGGGGKTTVTSSVYDDISNKFDGCCFVENISEESNKYGLEKLQEKLLCGVLKGKQVGIGRVMEGRNLIKSNLCHRKVLIVLDDVDHLDQLNALAGSHELFGDGSRVIITTRNNHLLNAHKVNAIYNVSLLNDGEAIELFCKHAFQDSQPIEDYKLILKDVVSYAGGLPLALKVLGSFLCDKDMTEWKSALARLKEIPDSDIVKKLKISYDGLEHDQKELFLDIACFFRGEKKTEAMEIFDACGFHPVIGVKVLIQKALVTVSKYGCFDMHDLVQEMAHNIVRGEHPNNPEKHNRIWKKDDFQKLCHMDATAELNKTEAIKISSDIYDPLPHHHPRVVSKMKNLRWIAWRDNSSSLPTNFPQGELRCLILNGGLQRQLWKGYKYLPSLKMIKLHCLKNLIMTPEFGGLPNLERFMISRCPQLEEIHPSIGDLKRLVLLLIAGCNNLKMLPPIHKLEILLVSECSKLSLIGKRVASVEISHDLEHLTSYFVTYCFPCCCGNLYDDELSMGAEYLDEPLLLYKSMNSIDLQYISRGLRKLVLSDCHLGDADMDSDVWDLPNLQELNLSQNKFSRLNFALMKLPWLKWLDVSFCYSLLKLSELPSSIAVLRADDCYLLETAGNISNCKWLWKASIMGLNKLDGDILLKSMLQGNAIEDHFISFNLSGRYTPKGFVEKLVRGETFKLQLPNNWYDDFCGFLICNANSFPAPFVVISIKQELDKDSKCEVWQVPKEPTHHYFKSTTYVGYVSFNSLRRHTAWLNPAYNTISFSLGNKYETSSKSESSFIAKLICRRSNGDVNTTHCSDFYEEESEYGKTFTIQNHSRSHLKIIWDPLN